MEYLQFIFLELKNAEVVTLQHENEKLKYTVFCIHILESLATFTLQANVSQIWFFVLPIRDSDLFLSWLCEQHKPHGIWSFQFWLVPLSYVVLNPIHVRWFAMRPQCECFFCYFLFFVYIFYYNITNLQKKWAYNLHSKKHYKLGLDIHW